MELEKWFKIKKYPHIGFPITVKDFKWVKEYVNNPKNISDHSFLPFLHMCLKKRKFRPIKSANERNPSGQRKRVVGKPKSRDIFYASHFDSLIYSFYNVIIYNKYETFIKDKGFKNSIVAYRKIPVSQGSDHNKCNIDFAKDSFEFIESNNSENLSVIVADITSFFDNLNHRILKQQWSKILGMKTLPDDHYNIFKSLTRIKYVEGRQLFESYGNTMFIEAQLPNDTKGEKELKRKPITAVRYFKEKKAVAYCEKTEFFQNNLSLVISKNNEAGIPQGSPISATLANIYMLDFDNEVYNKIGSIGGFYQRYSDDMIIICNQKYEEEIISFIRSRIKDLTKLEIAPEKTKLYRFETIEGKFRGIEVSESTKEYNFNKTLEYLGFSFDGQRVLIKSAGFSKFYRSMKRSFKRSASLARNSKNPDKSIFKARLYKRFTYKGANRKLIYRPAKNDNKKYLATKEYYWGNYLSYVNKANKSMQSINNGDQIKRQSRRFWKNFHKLMISHSKTLPSAQV